MKFQILIFLFCFLIQIPFAMDLSGENYPSVNSSRSVRITNRRYISHISYQQINGNNFITFILTHPLYNAYKANSHQLYYECESYSECADFMIKINNFLISGYNLRLVLNGTTITNIDFLVP